MAYHFNLDGETFSGRTVPGSARMQVYHVSTNQFVAAFDPDSGSLLGDNPRGKWVAVSSAASNQLLEKIKPSVVSACRQRLLWFRQQRAAK